MPRVIIKTKAIVLRSRRMGETSKLMTFYTEEYGKLKSVARGARKPKSKYGAALELLSEVQIICYWRDNRDLQTLTECDILRTFPNLTADLQRLAFASAGCELIERLTIDGEPNPRLYQCLMGLLCGLNEVDLDQAESLFWYFQLRLATALGYHPQLASCVSCSQSLQGERLGFSAALGGALCASCGRREGQYANARSLNFLTQLQTLPTYTKEAIPPAPSRPGEIRAMLRTFLEYHGGASGQLKSLDFLEAIEKIPRVDIVRAT